jgi:predicted DNA-binding transcriptional regulator AlpA
MTDTPSEPEKTLLTIRDVMAWLQMSRSSVWRLIKRGELTPVYLNRQPRFLTADVEDMISRNRGGGSENASRFSD